MLRQLGRLLIFNVFYSDSGKCFRWRGSQSVLRIEKLKEAREEEKQVAGVRQNEPD